MTAQSIPPTVARSSLKTAVAGVHGPGRPQRDRRQHGFETVASDPKGPWMPRLAHSSRWLLAVAAAAGIGRMSAADEPGGYPPPQPLASWSDPSAAVPHDTPSSWSWGASAPATNPPRLLRARYQSPEIKPGPNGGSSNVPPAPVERVGATRPIPLSRRSSDSSSTLGGLSGGDRAQLVNAAMSLGIVLGLFLLVMWAVRRGMPKGSGLLPSEAVEVLGRTSLAGRQQVHLVRCGNKIVLLSVTPTGIRTLTEISDPAEVDRLHSVCQPPSPPAGPLRQFFGHFTGPSGSSDDSTREGADEIDFRHLEMGGQRRA